MMHLSMTKYYRIIPIFSFLLAFFLLAAAPTSLPSLAPKDASPIPLLAYYEIGFDSLTWEAYEGEDFPLVGRYSSDDFSVMRGHIRLAKSVGIEGFIVNWRYSETLNRRLAKLVEVAEAESFYLAIRYQSDEPLSAEELAADLDYIAHEYGDSVAFKLFERPLIICAAMADFSPDELSLVVASRKKRLLLLASTNDIEVYNKISHLVEGNALIKGFTQKEELERLEQAAHAHGGLWIPPVSLSARVELNENDEMIVYPRSASNLRQQMNVALESSPDTMAILSWNDFDAETHIEPSQEDGTSAIDLLKEIHGIVVPSIPDFDSSEPGETIEDPLDIRRVSTIGLMVVSFLISLVVLVRRDMQARRVEKRVEKEEDPL